MQRYANLGGDSNVAGFEASPGAIKVQFGDGSIYLYTDGSAGSANIQQMHGFALAGQGLNSFINRCVRKNYASKLR
jgi:hypothetical protein